jgi:hypothetical protein
MKILISKILFFLIIATTVLVPLTWSIRNAKNRVLVSAVFRLPKGTKTLIAGDSHMETGVSPRNLPYSYSIALSGENYFYTYSKLKYFIEVNNCINTVILGCSWHNFAKKYQESYLFGDKSSAMHGYFPLLGDEDKSVIKRWSPDYIVPFLVYDIGMPIGIYKDKFIVAGLIDAQIKKDDVNFYGGYKELTGSKYKDTSVKEKINLYFDGDYSNESNLMNTYLHKIIQLCEKNNLQIVLVNSPVHPYFKERVPEHFITAFNKQLTNIVKQYSHAKYIDMSSLTLPSSVYYDGDHMNKIGAAIVANYLAAEIKNMCSEGP